MTFPVPLLDPTPPEAPLTKPPGAWWDADLQMLIWPLAGSFAGIVGDLGQAPLADLAAHVTVESGRPRFSPVDGFTVAATTTIDPSVSHEMRYTSMELGQTSTLGWGQVWTVVLRGATLEGPALGGYGTPTGFVRGRPAVLFDTLIGTLIGIGDVGGNGMTLAWESAPGEETHLSFSGRMNSFLIDAKSLEALRALADKGTVLTPTQWLSLDRSRFGWRIGFGIGPGTVPMTIPRIATP